MDTIGTVIKNARKKRRLSREHIEKDTKIKKEFIKAIEDEDWSQLPELTVVKGFVRNLAQVLNINEKRVLALLRRDYPPKALVVNPKKELFEKFVWSPKFTFFLGVVIIIVAVLGYLSFQYSRFISPPSLDVFSPREEEIVTSGKIIISGKTDTDAIIKANNQPLIVDEDGHFEGEIEIVEGTDEILIKATSRGGKETSILRKIKVELVE